MTPIVGQEYCTSLERAEEYGDVWRWTGDEWQFNWADAGEPRRWRTETWGPTHFTPFHDPHDLHALAMALELADLVSDSLRDDGYFDGKRIDEPSWLLVSQWLRAEVLAALREMAA